MKKLILILLIALCCMQIFSQISPQTQRFRGYLSANPGSCSRTGEYYWNTSSLSNIYCTAAGTPGTWAGPGAIGSTVSGATVGSVFFAGASGVLAQDNANFFWDNTNKKLQLSNGAAGNAEAIKLFSTHANYAPWLNFYYNTSTFAGGIKPTYNGGLTIESQGTKFVDFGVFGVTPVVRLQAYSYETGGVSMTVNTPSATTVGQQINLFSGASANAFEIKDSTPSTIFSVNNLGILAPKYGAAVASAATITPTGNLFHVTGTTSITGISATGIVAGTCITMIFDGALTVTDNNGTLNTAGNFVTTADDTLSLCYDGTNWRETARSIN